MFVARARTDSLVIRLNRFSAQFARELGPQVVCGGYQVREDGVVRRWDFVSGEFKAR